MRVLAVTCVAVATLLLSGCLMSKRVVGVEDDEGNLVRVSAPSGGRSIPAARWQALMNAEGRPRTTRQGLWMFGVRISPDVDKAGSSDFEGNELGTVFFCDYSPVYSDISLRTLETDQEEDRIGTNRLQFQRFVLPWRLKLASAYYEGTGDGGVVTDRVWAEWNTFWAASGGVGSRRELVRTSSIPLIYSSLRMDLPKEVEPLEPELRAAEENPTHVHLLTSLAGAGPSRIAYESEKVDVSLLVPVAAWGPGFLAWTSLRVESPTSLLILHGPPPVAYIYGSDRGNSELGMLTWGALWYRKVEWDDYEARRRDYERQGPLWGMFGWGRKDARPAVYLLWMPIKVG
ncbi:MAG: hypothetical protein KF858_15225 [Candidatus Sumerlaeia bacterium]|nr:hypothetical protein [Candidatus Sumerlaeia bacterium]